MNTVSHLETIQLLPQEWMDKRFHALNDSLQSLLFGGVRAVALEECVSASGGAFQLDASLAASVPIDQYGNQLDPATYQLNVPIITASQFGHTVFNDCMGDVYVFVIARSRLSGVVSDRVRCGKLSRGRSFTELTLVAFQRALTSRRQEQLRRPVARIEVSLVRPGDGE